MFQDNSATFELTYFSGSGLQDTGNLVQKNSRLIVIFSGFFALLAARQLFGQFNIHLGYIYMVLIILSGYWYGIRGGTASAFASYMILLAELYLFRDWPGRNSVLETLDVRLLYYMSTGVLSGIFFQLPNINRGQNFESEKLRGRFNLFGFPPSPPNRIIIVVVSFIALLLTRQAVGRFNFMLGYLYTALIFLCGWWFGVRGGLIAAVISSLIFVIEINLFKTWTYRDIVASNIFFRFTFYFLTGVTSGYLSLLQNKSVSKLSDMAFFDELTHCVNFRWAMHILGKEIARSRRYSSYLSIVMLDIDDFKKINDLYGHLVGNDVLRRFALTLKKALREEDIIGRYGGEEFLIILPETDSASALQACRKIKDAVFYEEFAIDGKRLPALTFSAGVASFPWQGDDVFSLLTSADNALYFAKKEGKNRIMQERRTKPRADVSKEVRIELLLPASEEDKPYFRVENISMSGMRLVSSINVDREKEFKCSLALAGGGAYETVTCRVVHGVMTKDNLHSLGVRFTDIPQKTSELLKLIASTGREWEVSDFTEA